MLATSAGLSAVRLQNPSSRARCGGQHPTLAAFPRGLVIDDLVGLAKRLHIIGQNVVNRFIRRVHKPEVGIAVEHTQEEIGVARLAHRQESYRLAKAASALRCSGVIGPKEDDDPITISVQAIAGKTAYPRNGFCT